MIRPPGDRKTQQQRRGAEGEALALQHLQAQGMKLICRNFTVHGLGEIDLIMMTSTRLHARLLVFVEVRYRRNGRYGGAGASITAAKRRRLFRAASAFRQNHAQYRQWPARFDVIAITGRLTNAQVTWIENAFEC